MRLFYDLKYIILNKIERNRHIICIYVCVYLYKIPEVQAAMQDQMNNLMSNQDQWMTPELMEKFATNPILRTAMSDPRCISALKEFQTNPSAAAKKYANIPGINDFFKEVGYILSM